MKKSAVKSIINHGIAVIVFMLISVMYFLPQFQGKTIASSDTIHYRGAAQEVKAFEEKTGEISYWTNSMFGGMPTYQISAPLRNNYVKYIERAANLFMARPAGYFIALMIGFYILMIVLGVNHWLALIGSIVFAFSSNNFVLYGAGHMSKIRAIAFFAPIVAGVLMTYRGKYLWGGVLFTVALAIDIYVNHPQMTYYLGMCLALFVIWQLVEDIKSKNLAHFTKASTILILGVVLSLGASSSRILSTLEYTKDTMRGEPILASTENVTTSSQTKGLEWNYAMSWSLGPLELFSGFIPGVAGGSSAEPVAKDSNFGKFMKRRGGRVSSDMRAPLYWGAMGSTSGTYYFGAAIFFFFFLGMFLVKGKLKWWTLAAVLLTYLISLGGNFEAFNRILFDYFPMYNNFRAHSSVMAVTSFLIPFFGVYTLSQIFQGKFTKDAVAKNVKIAGGILAAITLFFAFVGPGFFDFVAATDAQYADNPDFIKALKADRIALLRNDSLRALLFILISAGAVWALINKKLKKNYILIILALVFTVDMWQVGKRYLNDKSFVSKSSIEKNFKPRAVDSQILKDTDPNFRVFDMSINTFNSAKSSYFHKTIGGYHAAKLQRYQDLIDRHIGKGNQGVLDMLNTKYFITREEQAQQNQGACGNAWFVPSIKKVNSANAELDALTGFNPRNEAVVHQEFENYISGLNPDGNGSINLVTYQPNKLVYKSNSDTDQFAVFSEIWYGPNKGWYAYVDGQEVEHIRVNYALRGMKVPAGSHEIIFEFNPRTVKNYEMVSLVSSSLIFLALLGLIIMSGKEWYAKLPDDA